MAIDHETKIVPELDDCATLPSSWYVDPVRFEAEKSGIFHRSWQYAGNLDQLALPGSFFTMRTGDIPIVLTRDSGGKLHAFANVCRHRGSEVVLECAGNRQTLQCHYHGWTYNLDGTLRTAPHAADEPSFNPASLGLVEFPIESWGPLIFVNPDPQTEPLRKILGDLPRVFERERIEIGRLKFVRRDIYEIAANWKITVENFDECYHCPIAHPAFSRVFDVDNYEVDVEHEYFTLYRAPYLKSQGARVVYASIWPSLMLGLSADPLALQIICSRPVDAGHTWQAVDYYFADGTPDQVIREYVAFTDLVNREDIVLCESVQRGMLSGVVNRGRLMLSRERGIQHFQRLVARLCD